MVGKDRKGGKRESNVVTIKCCLVASQSLLSDKV